MDVTHIKLRQTRPITQLVSYRLQRNAEGNVKCPTDRSDGTTTPTGFADDCPHDLRKTSTHRRKRAILRAGDPTQTIALIYFHHLPSTVARRTTEEEAWTAHKGRTTGESGGSAGRYADAGTTLSTGRLGTQSADAHAVASR